MNLKRKGDKLTAMAWATIANQDRCAAISISQLSRYFNIDHGLARRIIHIIQGTFFDASNELYVPLDRQDQGTYRFDETFTYLHPQARLSQAEAESFITALNSWGWTEDKQTFFKLIDQLPATTENAQLLKSLYDQAEKTGSMKDGTKLFHLAFFLTSREAISFRYQKIGQTSDTARQVFPVDLHRQDNAWYLKAFDLNEEDLERPKIWRVDGIHEERLLKLEEKDRKRLAQAAKKQRGTGEGSESFFMEETQERLQLRAEDSYNLAGRAILWPFISHIEKTPEGDWQADIAYFGGTWLPRMICSCKGLVEVDDASVMEKARAQASTMLELLDSDAEVIL